MNTFTVPQVPGSRRRTKHVYTHALICKFDAARYEAELPKRLEEVDSRLLRSNFNFYSSVVSAGLGGQWSRGHVVDERLLEEAQRNLDAFGVTYEEWVASHRAAAVQRTETTLADADTGAYEVLQWSKSEKNAHKGISAHNNPRAYRTDFQVVPTIQIK